MWHGKIEDIFAFLAYMCKPRYFVAAMYPTVEDVM